MIAIISTTGISFRLEVDKNKKRLHDPMSSINKYLEKKTQT